MSCKTSDEEEIANRLVLWQSREGKTNRKRQHKTPLGNRLHEKLADKAHGVKSLMKGRTG